MAYARPVLCRLCGFPAPDGGVPVSQVDREKLSEWCLRVMDTELDQEGLDEVVFCQFCVWQARYLEENWDRTENNRMPSWWNQQCRKLDYGYKYFFDDVIQPCAVLLPTTSKELLHQGHGLLADIGTHRTQKRVQVVNYNCIYCSSAAQFATKIALWRHVKKEHKNDLTFCCSVCKMFFLSRQEKKIHAQKLHRVLTKWDSVNCIYCQLNFTKGAALRAHIKLEHKSISIKCNFRCSTYFHREEDKEKHTLEVHEKPCDRVLCIYCKKRVPKRNLSTHVSRIHNLFKIKCHYINCCTYFHTLEEKQKHILEVHESGEDKYRCIYCQKMIVNKDSKLLLHMKRSHKKESIKCDYQFNCPNYFLTQDEKQKHIQEVHESGEDKIRCQFCPKIVPIVRMQRHISDKHKFEKQGVQDEWVECVYCKKQLKKYIFTTHMVKKHKTEIIKCNFKKRNCSTFFLTLEDRQKHIDQVHMTGKEVDDFECCFCSKKTLSMSGIRRHVKLRHPEAIRCKKRGCLQLFLCKITQEEHFEKVHVPEEKGKTYKCTYCKFVATSREERDAHSAQVHAKATYKCPKCPKMFKSKSALRIHVGYVHGTRRRCPHCQNLIILLRWSQHMQGTTCQTCKTYLTCRGTRVTHSRSCISQF